MLPSYRPGQLLLLRVVGDAASAIDSVQPGDVVIVRHAGLEKLKRVRHVRHGEVFIVGDNPVDSTDSRSFGWLPTGAIVGRVLWPKRHI
jgi:hypothetical protein